MRVLSACSRLRVHRGLRRVGALHQVPQQLLRYLTWTYTPRVHLTYKPPNLLRISKSLRCAQLLL